MSVPHDEPQKVVSEKAENWLDNARKQLIPNKVDWSVSDYLQVELMVPIIILCHFFHLLSSV